MNMPYNRPGNMMGWLFYMVLFISTALFYACGENGGAVDDEEDIIDPNLYWTSSWDRFDIIALEGDSPLKRALMFGLLIFGTNWWFFNQFELLLMEISWADPVLRVVVDVVMVALGVFVVEKFVPKTA